MVDVKHELRKPDGEWTKTPGGRMPSAGSGDDEVLRPVVSRKVSNTKFEGEPSYSEVAEDYDWRNRDKFGSDGTATSNRSIRIQGQAQIHAKTFDANTDGGSSADDQYAASLWKQYQSASLYTKINSILRDGKQEPGDPPAALLRAAAKTLFAKAGYSVPQDTTVYRALKTSPGPVDWKKKLTPGTVFEDDGMVSTTAHSRFAQGWLTLGKSVDGSSAAKRKTGADDVVMEVRLPAGTRIVGGDPMFIETMLPPGTKFKVISSETRKATDPSNPLGNEGLPPFTYTHVVAEVQP